MPPTPPPLYSWPPPVASGNTVKFYRKSKKANFWLTLFYALIFLEVPKICRLKVNKEQCGELREQYFFNLSSMTCEKFISGGCHNNENRFPDEATCMDFCAPKRGKYSLCGVCTSFLYLDFRVKTLIIWYEIKLVCSLMISRIIWYQSAHYCLMREYFYMWECELEG